MVRAITEAEVANAVKAQELMQDAFAAQAKQKLDQATKLALEASTTGPAPIDAVRLSQLLIALGQSGEAEQLCERMVQHLQDVANTESDSGDALAQIGHLYFEFGREDLAEPLLMAGAGAWHAGQPARACVADLVAQAGRSQPGDRYLGAVDQRLRRSGA